MIVDSSAVVALLRGEPEAAAISGKLLAHSGELRMSAASYLEAAIVIDQNEGVALSAKFDAIIAELAIEIVPVTAQHAAAGRRAYREFGKGRHPARLNFGDCFAYALARVTGEPLLFKGEDFAHTDILAA